jgi:hypothetical protein
VDLVELGARSMDLVGLEFLELGCLAGKKWSGAVLLDLELPGALPNMPRITYAELLDPSPGGLVGVSEGHVRCRSAIVPRNVCEPSKKVSVPRRRAVDRPHRLANTRQSSQHRGILQTESHLADREVEHVCLWPSTVHEHGDQRGVVAEPRQSLRPRNFSS